MWCDRVLIFNTGGKNMELSKQVTSKDLSMRLKSLGVPQNSLFYWLNGLLGSHSLKEIQDLEWTNTNGLSKHQIFSAFTSSEIGEMLPDHSYSFFVNDKWGCTCSETPTNQIADTEAECRGLMLEYLLKNGLLK